MPFSFVIMTLTFSNPCYRSPTDTESPSTKLDDMVTEHGVGIFDEESDSCSSSIPHSSEFSSGMGAFVYSRLFLDQFRYASQSYEC